MMRESAFSESEAVNKRRIGLVLGALIVPFVLLRVGLSIDPNADFNVGGYNIHHLYIGLLLITLGGLPLALFRGASRWLDLAAVVFGVGLSLALDEWVYLLVTDGSNTSYLLPVSFWGGLGMIVLACGYVGVLVMVQRGRAKRRNLQE